MHSVPEVISGSLECRVLDKVPGDGQGVDSEGRDGTVVDHVLQHQVGGLTTRLN